MNLGSPSVAPLCTAVNGRVFHTRGFQQKLTGGPCEASFLPRLQNADSVLHLPAVPFEGSFGSLGCAGIDEQPLNVRSLDSSFEGVASTA